MLENRYYDHPYGIQI